MFRHTVKTISLRVVLSAAGLLGLALPSQPARAWEQDGHRIINKLAASNLPADMPAFLRTQAAIDEIEYLGPEPDRWRSSAEAFEMRSLSNAVNSLLSTLGRF